MRLSAFVRFFLFIFLIGYFLITGCTVGKNPDQASLEQALSPKAQHFLEASKAEVGQALLYPLS